MAGRRPIPIDQEGAGRVRLNSWKEIATHLGREVRTVQRWEKAEGLPVRRLAHAKRGSVYAYVWELDEWVASRDCSVAGENDTAEARGTAWRLYPLAMVGAICAMAIVVAFFAQPSDRATSVRASTNMAPVSLAARDAYLRGLYYFNRGNAPDLEAGIGYFQKVIAADPMCAAAYARMSEAQLRLGLGRRDGVGRMQLARGAAAHALQLDPKLAEAHEAQGEIRAYADWDWQGAEREYRRALELNPDLGSAHSGYAQIEGLLGRGEVAIAEAKRARELEALSSLLAADLAWYYYWARRYDEAITTSREVLPSKPGFASAQSCIVRSLVAQRRFEEARTELVRQIGKGARNGQPSLEDTSAEQAIRNYYAWNVGRLEVAEQKADISLFDLALGLAFLGRTDDLMGCLEKALELRQGIVAVMAVERYFEPYRQDTRFERIAEKVGLPVAAAKVAADQRIAHGLGQ